jgi:hypothetical protein
MGSPRARSSHVRLSLSLPSAFSLNLPSYSHSHTRHATGMALGSLSLNLALPDSLTSSVSSFTATLSSLLPRLTSLDLSIPSLNDPKTRLAPRSRDESLESGQLQLAAGTAVVVDLTKIGEGKLEDTGTTLIFARSNRPSILTVVFFFSSRRSKPPSRRHEHSPAEALVPVPLLFF